MTPGATTMWMNSFGLALNTPNVAAQCRGCLDRAGSARYRPTGRP